ncbi:bile acid:sodium symporter family protein [Nocardia uniformis]|uniref:Bile acid:sodium symporter family protein n=1 Tax=Nocardia uniformis TaxID=53432 RepID=A0A849BVC6_9NOCA|nr:bile acid:sodium symporter family protein [Nocardia uniformis]NNH70512.1 bile acid:sodium symporter family protein [Nocardia uniformis]
MGSSVFAVFLPLALALVMFGLGLTLTVEDFARVLKYPKAAVVALACQIVLLPVICFGMVLAFGLTGALAVGMLLLVASPGGTSANLFSHIAGGDVALNITLTAINSVLAVFTMPVVVTLAIARFMDADSTIGLQPAKFIQVIAIVLIPVAIGMWVRRKYSGWAERMRKPVKIGSVVVLVLVILAAVVSGFSAVRDDLAKIGTIALLLSVCSLLVGYFVPRLFGIGKAQAIASAMEIGIHNATLAIAVAVTALDNETMAIPAATYGIVMFGPAALAAYLLARQAKRTPEVVVAE